MAAVDRDESVHLTLNTDAPESTTMSRADITRASSAAGRVYSRAMNLYEKINNVLSSVPSQNIEQSEEQEVTDDTEETGDEQTTSLRITC